MFYLRKWMLYIALNVNISLNVGTLVYRTELQQQQSHLILNVYTKVLNFSHTKLPSFTKFSECILRT